MLSTKVDYSIELGKELFSEAALFASIRGAGTEFLEQRFFLEVIMHIVCAQLTSARALSGLGGLEEIKYN